MTTFGPSEPKKAPGAPQRIGLLALRPPDPRGVAAQRWCHALTKGLRANGHAVTVFAGFSESEGAGVTARLAALGAGLVRWPSRPRRSAWLGRLAARLRPFGWDHTRADAAQLRTHAAALDWWLCDETFSGWAGLAAGGPALLHTHCLRSIDLAGHSFSAGDRVRIGRMNRAERRLIRSFRDHVTASPRVAERIHAWHAGAEVTGIPLTLDLDEYPARLPDQPREPGRAVLFGTMRWGPTAAAARHLVEDLWPEIRRRCPGATLEIAGEGTREMLGRHDGRDGVAIRGRVEEIGPYWRAGGVMLFPVVQSTGVKIKVLEALAHGVPVVTTPAGAEGLALESGRSACLCGDDAEFIAASARLLADPVAQESMARAGRQFLETRLDATRIAAEFAAVGAGMAGRRPR